MIPGFSGGRRRFSDLNEQEILALAISAEEDDARIYATYAEKLRAQFPASATVFDGMADEENEHRRRLIDEFARRFDGPIPLIRREHVAGFYARRPVWLIENLAIDRIRDEAARMERDAHDFYMRAAQSSGDPGTRKLLGDLAAAEKSHERHAEGLVEAHVGDAAKDDEAAQSHRQFVLTWVQPGLAGLMDGSVSTLAPIFATAFATQDTWTTFLVGAAASVRAGLSTRGAAPSRLGMIGGVGESAGLSG